MTFDIEMTGGCASMNIELSRDAADVLPPYNAQVLHIKGKRPDESFNDIVVF